MKAVNPGRRSLLHHLSGRNGIPAKMQGAVGGTNSVEHRNYCLAKICRQVVLVMFEILWTVLIYPRSLLRSQHQLAKEVLALRHQITALKRRRHRPKLRLRDQCLWMTLTRAWPNWKAPLVIFRPETIIGWQRAGFRMFWL
jgi:hypothetical protein